MRLRVFLRCIRDGRWLFAALLLNNFWYGITHRGCRQCGKPKPWQESRCYTCQLMNLKRGLFEERQREGMSQT